MEPAYVISEQGEGSWRVFKVDLSTLTILAEHAVSNGRCDCEGWKHNMKCRHLQMAFGMYPVVTRAQARKAVGAVKRHSRRLPLRQTPVMVLYPDRRPSRTPPD